MYKLSLAHLYPNLLNQCGDIGNIAAICKRCEWRGIDVEVTNIDIGDIINPDNFDIYFISGGQEPQQILVSKELQRQHGAFSTASEQNSVFLGVCGGYELLGKYYQKRDGEKINGLGLLDVHTIAGENRFIGNVTTKCEFLIPSFLVGFENHNGRAYLEDGTTPLAYIEVGNGNNGEDKTEGARKRNVFGTYMHGSILPKNPHFADYLIGLALEKKYKEKIELKPIDDEFEYLAHDSLVGKKY